MKKQTNWLNLFKNFDNFGVSQNLRFNSSDKYTSIFGGCLFLFYSILGIAYFSSQLYLFISRVNFNVSSTVQIFTPSPFMNFKEMNFSLAFGVQFDKNNSIADEAMDNFFDHSINYRISINGTSTVTKFEMRKCTNEDFYYTDKDTVQRNNLLKYYCLTNNNLTIGGLFSEINFQYVRYNLAFKKNILKTYTADYLKNYLLNNPLTSTVYCSDHSIITDNYINPVGLFMNTYSTLIDFNFQKNLAMEYILFQFTDDKNILWNNPSTSNYIKLYYGSEYFITIPNNSDSNFQISSASNVISYYFKSNPNSSVISRNYQKFPDFLAGVTSMLSNGLILLAFLVTFINEYKLNSSLINKIILFKESLKTKDHLMKQIKKFSLFKDLHTKKNSASLPEEKDDELVQSFERPSKNNKLWVNLNEYPARFNDNIFIKSIDQINHNLSYNKKENQTHIKDQLEKSVTIQLPVVQLENTNMIPQIHQKINDKSLNFSYFEIILSNFFCCKNRKIKDKKSLYKYGRDHIFYYIDMITIIKNIQELDVIKKILFTKEESSLISFLSKSVLSQDEQQKLVSSESILTSQELELVEKNLKCIIEKNPSNNKLIDLFYEKINEITNDENNYQN